MKTALIFDLSGTLVQMRPAKLLLNKSSIATAVRYFDLGIVTGAKKTETMNILKKLKIDRYFKFIITADTSNYRKPDSKLLFLIDGNYERISYIGDTKKDYQLAKNANIDFYYVGKKKWGIYQNTNINRIFSYIIKTANDKTH